MKILFYFPTITFFLKHAHHLPKRNLHHETILLELRLIFKSNTMTPNQFNISKHQMSVALKTVF